MHMSKFLFSSGILILAFIASLFSTRQALSANIYTYMESGRKIIAVSGPVELGDSEKFVKALGRNLPDMVLLGSPGGNLSEGLAIAAEIALLGLPTFVDERRGCFSACALIWVAGNPRIMNENAQIGVHAAYHLVEYSGGSLEAEISSVGNANIGAFLNELGLDIDAVEFFVRPKPNTIALLTAAKARQLNIPVKTVDNDGNISDPQPSPRQLVAEAALYAQLSRLCAILLDADSNVLEQTSEYWLRRAHETFDNSLVIDLISQEARRIRFEISESGMLPWCLNAFLRLTDKSQPIGIQGPSFACSRAESAAERSICLDRRLWVYDRILSVVYTARRQTLSDSDSRDIRTGQRGWLKRRDECRTNLACLETMYQIRLSEIR